jgi:putative transcriptional regulator
MESLQGKLLIASPTLVDPNFARTVVLVAAHSGEGALGLILNHELTMTVPDVWSQVSKSACLRDELVRHGGPVAGSLMALHDHRSLADMIVTDDVYVATELNTMESLAASVEGRVVFYVGHSGWGAGQLESELAEGSWLLLPATSEHVFGDLDPVALWKLAATAAGRQQVAALVPIKHIPENPRAN